MIYEFSTLDFWTVSSFWPAQSYAVAGGEESPCYGNLLIQRAAPAIATRPELRSCWRVAGGDPSSLGIPPYQSVQGYAQDDEGGGIARDNEEYNPTYQLNNLVM